MGERIVVLGGGFAGMYAARELRRRAPGSARIELISAENYFVFQPLLPEVAAGSIAPLHAVSPLRFLLPGVFVRKATVDGIDFDRQVVTVFQGVQRRPTEVPYDHLVIAVGQATDLSRVPGLAEHALTMKTLEDARRLRAHIIERLEHAEITGLPEVKQEALTFTVIGAGFSGIETVGEMKDLIDNSLRFYPNITPAEVRVVVLEFQPRLLAEMPERLADYAAQKLAGRGIELKLGTGVASASGTRLVTSTGEVIGTRTIVATIGSAPWPLIQRLPLPREHGRIRVTRTLAVEGHRNVWALGDCALIPMRDEPRERTDFAPPTAQFAIREAQCVAGNIIATLKGQPAKPFVYTSRGALASLGARRGVADVMSVQITGFAAWLLWRCYYLLFLPGFSTKIRVLINWFLDGISPRSVVQLRSFTPSAARHVRYHAGDRVFEAGNRADGLYTVVSGLLEVSQTDPETGAVTRREVGPGGHVGERMILGETRRVSTVRALEDSQVLVLEREEFLRLAESFVAFRTYFQGYFRETLGIEWRPEFARQGMGTQPARPTARAS